MEASSRGRPRLFNFPLVCQCGYTTSVAYHYRRHAQTCSKALPIESYYIKNDSTENEDDPGRRSQAVTSDTGEITFLRNQVIQKDQQLLDKDKTIKKLITDHEKQMREKDRQIHELMKDRWIKEQHEESVEKPKKRSKKSSSRPNLTEPERRAIAKRQDWKCNNPHGVCNLPGELEAFDIDHVIPRWKNGSDHPDNLQALCPGCHRFKTDHERVDREAWESLCARLEALAEG